MTVDLAERSVGSLVIYSSYPGEPPEYGLIETVRNGTVYVRFHLGDTAAGCNPAHLTLRVPAFRPEVDKEIERRVALAARPVPELKPETYNKLMDFLLDECKTTAVSRSALLLAGEIGPQIGAAAQRARRKEVTSD